MPRVATKLTSARDGGWKARKRIPEDVRDAFGGRWEMFFKCGPMPAVLARAKHREWLTEIDTRIENSRAEKRGEGQTLTPMQARALSGEWYHWYTARHLPNAKTWGEEYWEHLIDELRDVVRKANGWRLDDPDPMELYHEDPAAKQGVLAAVADHAESSIFLNSKGLVLEPASREMFLDCLQHDYLAAIRLLIRRANDDYGT